MNFILLKLELTEIVEFKLQYISYPLTLNNYYIIYLDITGKYIDNFATIFRMEGKLKKAYEMANLESGNDAEEEPVVKVSSEWLPLVNISF